MKIITEAECQSVLETALKGNNFRNAFVTNFAHYVSYAMPADTGQKTALAEALVHHIDFGEFGLFWITGWGIWQSAQNMDLFDGYRRSLGEMRMLHEAPGHIFDKSDRKEIVCLLDLVLYFYWDAVIFNSLGSLAVETSHDEYFSIYAKDMASLNEIQSKLDAFSLKKIS